MEYLLYVAVICSLHLQANAQIVEENGVKVKHIPNRLYDMNLDMDPISVQLIKDPRLSSATIPVYDLAFMSYFPRSEVRMIPDLTVKINHPAQMAGRQLVVTDQATIIYPNNIGVLPPDTIEKQPPYVWWIAAGSFGRSSSFQNNEGGIYLIDMSSNTWVPSPIHKEKQAGFSNAAWYDMDLDGRKDCVTISGSANRAQLIWLRQPASGNWERNAISNQTLDVGGTDFRVLNLQQRGVRKQMVIVVAGRRTARLTAYFVNDPDNDWTQTTSIESSIIAQSGAYVSVEIADLNGDGNPEVLTSVAAVGSRPGLLIAFEAPKGGVTKRSVWRKHIIYEWPVQPGSSFLKISPGPAYTFHIDSLGIQSKRKPHILVSGADDGRCYILSPKSWSPFIWTYNIDTIYGGSTAVGIPSVADVDGDGHVEVFIPSGQTIHVLRYEPSASTKLSQSVVLMACNIVIFIVALYC